MARVSIEDCLMKLENRFALVNIAAARTRQLMDGAESTVASKNKFAVTALREIAEGNITTDLPDVVKAGLREKAHARQLEEEFS